ncbi:unnamed protein product [Bursaphelenchus okinawaensis]|uniref:Uncharacterized protein n=1 Tax=Bursaphelenchus okinawaensis TaxID=465554 RepID=A0A811KWR8_9BILA|nr:unnamed protein product [Bursaphelenchus okinawaensis]CAG9113119.1 unnamed protein product [Bursaphelenchus okinawaensis]
MFYWIHFQVKYNLLAYGTLSECFEIRQTKMVLNYIKSLITSFVILLTICGIGQSTVMYLRFVEKQEEEEPIVMLTYLGLYVSLCTYNFISMLYMIRSFPQLQKAIIKDLPFFEITPHNIVPVKAPEEDTESYFQQLEASWNTQLSKLKQ